MRGTLCTVRTQQLRNAIGSLAIVVVTSGPKENWTLPEATILLSVLLFLFTPTQATAQDQPQSDRVLTWTEGATPPKASIADVRWMEGGWEGPLESAMQQYSVFSPVSGHMPGFTRAWGPDGAIWFYEINDLVEVHGSLEFRVKHFSGELSGWEGKDQFVRHRLITITDHALYFDGLTIVKEGADHFTVYVRITDGDRKGQIVVVHQRRIPKQ